MIYCVSHEIHEIFAFEPKQPSKQKGTIMGLDQWIFKRVDGAQPKEECYWRKANQIHAFFLSKAPEGYDPDTQESISIKKEDLNELMEKCNQIKQAVSESKWNPDVQTEDYNNMPEDLAEKCSEILPSMSGFFFGGTVYDSWYYSDITSTLEKIQTILDNWDENAEYVYSCWW